MACRRAGTYIGVYWRDEPKFLGGSYWIMSGGSSTRASISRTDKYGDVKYEKHSIKECETKTFSSGHKVRITNSNGKTCYISVTAPLPIIKPIIPIIKPSIPIIKPIIPTINSIIPKTPEFINESPLINEEITSKSKIWLTLIPIIIILYILNRGNKK